MRNPSLTPSNDPDVCPTDMLARGFDDAIDLICCQPPVCPPGETLDNSALACEKWSVLVVRLDTYRSSHLCFTNSPAGKYKEVEVSGMDQPCSVCPAGRIAEATGSTNCTACQQGRYLSDDAISPTLHDSASDCTGCEVGTATSSEGQTQCEICGAGRVAVTSGLIECALCMFVLTSALFSPSPVPKAPRPPPPSLPLLSLR